MYSYVIEVADFESERIFCDYAILTELFAFYHLQENALVDQDIVVIYILYLKTLTLILLFCNFVSPIFKVVSLSTVYSLE